VLLKITKIMNYDDNGLLVGNGKGVVVEAKPCTYRDVFPVLEETDRFGNMMPDIVQRNYKEIQAQKNLAQAAALIMDTVKQMETMNLTDDQRRVARIKERMLKRKLTAK